MCLSQKKTKCVDSDSDVGSSLGGKEDSVVDVDDGSAFECSEDSKSLSDMEEAPLPPPPLPPPPSPPKDLVLAEPELPPVAKGIGIQPFLEKAPSGRAVCYHCDKRIELGSWRLDYKSKISTSLRDCRRAHLHCAGAIAKDADLSVLERLQIDHRDNGELYDTLERMMAETRARLGVAASGSSGSCG